VGKNELGRNVKCTQMSGNRTNSFETPEETVTDYPVLCIIMHFMSVIHTMPQ